LPEAWWKRTWLHSSCAAPGPVVRSEPQPAVRTSATSAMGRNDLDMIGSTVKRVNPVPPFPRHRTKTQPIGDLQVKQQVDFGPGRIAAILRQESDDPSQKAEAGPATAPVRRARPPAVAASGLSESGEPRGLPGEREGPDAFFVVVPYQERLVAIPAVANLQPPPLEERSSHLEREDVVVVARLFLLPHADDDEIRQVLVGIGGRFEAAARLARPTPRQTSREQPSHFVTAERGTDRVGSVRAESVLELHQHPAQVARPDADEPVIVALIGTEGDGALAVALLHLQRLALETDAPHVQSEGRGEVAARRQLVGEREVGPDLIALAGASVVLAPELDARLQRPARTQFESRPQRSPRPLEIALRGVGIGACPPTGVEAEQSATAPQRKVSLQTRFRLRARLAGKPVVPFEESAHGK